MESDILKTVVSYTVVFRCTELVLIARWQHLNVTWITVSTLLEPIHN